MVRKLGLRGFIKPTQKRQKSISIKERKMSTGAITSIDECFFSSVDVLPPYTDNDVLEDL